MRRPRFQNLKLTLTFFSFSHSGGTFYSVFFGYCISTLLALAGCKYGRELQQHGYITGFHSDSLDSVYSTSQYRPQQQMGGSRAFMDNTTQEQLLVPGNVQFAPASTGYVTMAAAVPTAQAADYTGGQGEAYVVAEAVAMPSAAVAQDAYNPNWKA